MVARRSPCAAIATAAIVPRAAPERTAHRVGAYDKYDVVTPCGDPHAPPYAAGYVTTPLGAYDAADAPPYVTYCGCALCPWPCP
jgi:hypothetical protein